MPLKPIPMQTLPVESLFDTFKSKLTTWGVSTSNLSLNCLIKWLRFALQCQRGVLFMRSSAVSWKKISTRCKQWVIQYAGGDKYLRLLLTDFLGQEHRTSLQKLSQMCVVQTDEREQKAPRNCVVRGGIIVEESGRGVRECLPNRRCRRIFRFILIVTIVCWLILDNRGRCIIIHGGARINALGKRTTNKASCVRRRSAVILVHA